MTLVVSVRSKLSSVTILTLSRGGYFLAEHVQPLWQRAAAIRSRQHKASKTSLKASKSRKKRNGRYRGKNGTNIGFEQHWYSLRKK